MIIGAMKAGTSTLYNLLRRHPRICPGRTKELNFFVRDGTVAAYDAMFPDFDPRRHAWRLDGSTNYAKRLRFPGVAGRIAAHGDDVRLIYLLRDPIRRLRSHVNHSIRIGRWNPEGSKPLKLARYIDVSSYSAQIAEYEAAGLGDRLLLLDFEELTSHSNRTLDRVYDFVGLERHYPWLRWASNVNRRWRSADDGIDLARARAELADEKRIMLERYGFEPARNWAD
jgi:hypothetical protein